MKNSKLIEALNNCVAHCNYCADACLDEDNLEMMVTCIRTDRACAEICNATAALLAFDHASAKAMVEQCRAICKECAEECEKHDSQHCKDCAEACKKCAEACEAYLA
tara:strand:+ start:988 stop:1308 length:321 start_codon:yes stop_codon:yes gene_type:complete